MTWKEMEGKVLEGMKKEQREWVQREVNLEGDNDLHEKSREQLIRMFPDESGGRLSLKDTACMKTLIWQAWMKIKVGEVEPVQGNIRTFWYREAEPFYVEKDLLDSDVSHPVEMADLIAALSQMDRETLNGALGDGEEGAAGNVLALLGKRDPELAARVSHAGRETYICNLISDCLDTFVLEGIFRFQGEFKFADPRQEWRVIGERRPRLIFFTEKEGLWWLCEYAARTHGITAIASQGEPGLLAMEYVYDDLRNQEVGSVEVGALTDYDPWGYNIAVQFAGKLREQIFFGAGNVGQTVLNGTQEDLKMLFEPAEIERGKRDLRKYSQYKQGQVETWFLKTGGIDNERFGIHVDLAKRDRLRAAVDRWVRSVG